MSALYFDKLCHTINTQTEPIGATTDDQDEAWDIYAGRGHPASQPRISSLTENTFSYFIFFLHSLQELEQASPDLVC